MPLLPIDAKHALQIQAGTLGRKAGHEFEASIVTELNSIPRTYRVPSRKMKGHVFSGTPGHSLLNYICQSENITRVENVTAISTGALATSEEGRKLLSVNGQDVKACKSDVILILKPVKGEPLTIGVSTKNCEKKSPTNAQLYFTTAEAFVVLLKRNGIAVSANALKALKQFCGDEGYRPKDDPKIAQTHKAHPERFFWEEVDKKGRLELEAIFEKFHTKIFTLLLQKAYKDDPFVPEYVAHKIRKAANLESTELALYKITELVKQSERYSGFKTRPYSVRKGSYIDPKGITHDAPRFGVVQMQRGGQRQHPTQLQFNLEAGYFYNLAEKLDDVSADCESE